MIIILVDIPDNTDNQEIENLIRPSIKNGHIENISIMAQKNTGTHDLQYHGLVTITPDSAAKEVIQKLNGNQIDGRHLVIHEYKSRYSHDDPRISIDRPEELTDKRQGDRRGRYSENYLISTQKL